ncbi:hypothetical protein ACSFA8_20810 [Variovorax sp. RT4R15]|uniref:hypothetical protein n=1 Tax=Variovorax sp. RT4R15 TaxID=3443737 RepID=UPI003F481A07
MNLNRTTRQPSQAPHEAQAEREAFEAAVEVKEATASDWLMATVGAQNEVPHSRGEKVVQLRAAPSEDWSLS